MATNDIRQFLAAFPDRRVWIDGETRRAEGEWNSAVYAEELIEEDEDNQGLIPLRIQDEVIHPMLADIAAYLGVEGLESYEDQDCWMFEAFGRGFQVSLYHFDVNGRPLDLPYQMGVRLIARLEPDPQWDEDNEDSPLLMVSR